MPAGANHPNLAKIKQDAESQALKFSFAVGRKTTEKENRMNKLNRIKNFAVTITRKVKQKMYYGIQMLKDNSGMSVIELLLILVVLIALIMIFKEQLTELVKSIFDKITSESGKI